MTKASLYKCPICKGKFLEVEFYLNSNIFWEVHLEDKLAAFGGSFCSLECLNVFLKKFNLKAVLEDTNSIKREMKMTLWEKAVCSFGKMKLKNQISDKLKDIPYWFCKVKANGEQSLNIPIYIKDLEPIKKVSNKIYILQLKKFEKAINKIANNKPEYVEGEFAIDNNPYN